MYAGIPNRRTGSSRTAANSVTTAAVRRAVLTSRWRTVAVCRQVRRRSCARLSALRARSFFARPHVVVRARPARARTKDLDQAHGVPRTESLARERRGRRPRGVQRVAVLDRLANRAPNSFTRRVVQTRETRHLEERRIDALARVQRVHRLVRRVHRESGAERLDRDEPGIVDVDAAPELYVARGVQRRK